MTMIKKVTIFLIVLVVLGALIGGETPEQKAASAAQKRIDDEIFNLVYDLKKQIKRNARDPDSVQFRNESGLCFEYNAKNAFGAYVGFERVCAKKP
jgi:hypothetical protein